MVRVKNLEVNATVNLAGWVTCAIALYVQYPANLVHAQMTQRSANATKIILAQHVTGKLCLVFRAFKLLSIII